MMIIIIIAIGAVVKFRGFQVYALALWRYGTHCRTGEAGQTKSASAAAHTPPAAPSIISHFFVIASYCLSIAVRPHVYHPTAAATAELPHTTPSLPRVGQQLLRSLRVTTTTTLFLVRDLSSSSFFLSYSLLFSCLLSFSFRVARNVNNNYDSPPLPALVRLPLPWAKKRTARPSPRGVMIINARALAHIYIYIYIYIYT